MVVAMNQLAAGVGCQTRRVGRSFLAASIAALVLSACGGGGGGGGESANSSTEHTNASGNGNANQEVVTPTSPDDRGAQRLLAQASFGGTPADVAQVKSLGYEAWIDAQLQAPSTQPTQLATVEAASTAAGTDKPRARDMVYAWWTHAVQDQAQLRQRLAYALSQIFVVSTVDAVLADNGRMVASYQDMLTEKSTGTYRELLEAVTLHPAMGQYLSHARNRKEDAASGRIPDENFAREVMQLFTIGLYELNPDGSLKLRDGKPIETYGPDDIKGLAKVFTGWSAYRPAGVQAVWWQCFWQVAPCKLASQDITPMSPYTEEHSTSEKKFLGVTVPAQTTANPQASLKIALDRLATHPNTAPFISRQLIQRLVTSNPSPAYIGRVSQVFTSTGGQLKAVVKAILMDPEARTPTSATVNMQGYGKLREPVLRLAQLLRAVPHTSSNFNAGGNVPFYMATNTDDQASGLGQTPLNSPSVFNFFRPGYKPPQSELSGHQLVSPEMQLNSETSVLGYAQFMAFILEKGWGGYNTTTQKLDIQFNLQSFMDLDTGNNQSGAEALVAEVSQRLLGKALPDAARVQAVSAVSALPRVTTYEKRRRAVTALLMVLVSPSFTIQQ